MIYGIGYLDLEIQGIQAVLILVTVLCAQWLCTRIWKLPSFDPRSACISGLSLCLLLRTSSLLLAFLTACITILSKFLFRWKHRHLFNPTNLGIVAMLLFTDCVWVSPGQWGSTALLGFFMACLGGVVVNRALRSDVTYSFLGCYMVLLFGRSIWLNEPMSIPWHRLQNGALILFAFFMISDPKSTPDSRTGRVLFGGLVAVGTAFVHFYLYRNNGLFYSLALFSMAVPMLNRLFPGEQYDWRKAVRQDLGDGKS